MFNIKSPWIKMLRFPLIPLIEYKEEQEEIPPQIHEFNTVIIPKINNYILKYNRGILDTSRYSIMSEIMCLAARSRVLVESMR